MNKSIRDKQERRDKDIDDLDDYYSYNPFGRGGGGAPLRDQCGNVITTRKPQHRNEYTRLHLNRRSDMSVATRSKSRMSGRDG